MMRVSFHVSGIRCVFAQNHKSERDALILLSLSLTWFCAKTQRIPDTWDGIVHRSIVSPALKSMMERYTENGQDLSERISFDIASKRFSIHKRVL